MITVDEALSIIEKFAEHLPSEVVALNHARRRVLREDIKADTDLPPFTRSAVDGYAVRDGDQSESFTIRGVVQPGDLPSFTLEKGQCARVFTGSGLPKNGTRIFKQEDIEVQNQAIHVPSANASIYRNPDLYIRTQGEDAKSGEVLIKTGQRLRPADLGILASVGAIRPNVTKVPRVAHFVSGNELVEPQTVPHGTQIRDANSTLISSLIDQAGARIVHQARVPDDMGTTFEQISAVPANTYDILLFSGGVSVGAFDFCQAIFQNFEFKIHIHGVNVKPGKPLIFGTRGKQLAFGIPGNPVSHFVTFHLFIRPALIALMRGKAEDYRMVGQLTQDINEPPNEREIYWPGHWSMKPEGLVVEPLHWRSSGHLSCLSKSNALLKIPANSGPIKAGTQVQWLAV